MNGSKQERAFMAVLRDHGFIPMRSPGSGTGDWEQPDVLAAQEGVAIATEMKSGAKPKNVQEHEVDALTAFADAFWAAALIAVRYKGDRTIYLAQPEMMNRTPSGHYSIPSSEADLNWDVALPYTVGDDGVEAATDVGYGGVIWPDDVAGDPTAPAPSLRDWLDALTAAQQGFTVRSGIVDMKADRAKGVTDDE
jgi:Holliday junction resolvase